MDAFENLDVWKRSSRLCVDLYQALRRCRDRGFKDQITRAALSVPSNIAEGCERDSNKEYIRFLRIAKGSCGELRTQLYIGAEIGYLSRTVMKTMVSEARDINRMLHGLIRSLVESDNDADLKS
ncbi:MAG TPA: four helix bundle protein [Gammaproteobacteria bacterium]|nr:four helix bundle protein [Gammaproteobacteria bacterium]